MSNVFSFMSLYSRIPVHLTKNDKSVAGISILALGFFLLGVVLDPLHFWKSGVPQVSDFIFACFILLVFIRSFCGGLPLLGRALFLPIFLFLTVAAVVSLLNAVVAPRVVVDFLRIIFVVVLSFSFWQLWNSLNGQIEKERLARALATTVIFSFIFAVSLNFNERPRFNGSFNNPNQMGFYLTFVCCFFLVSIKYRILPVWISRAMILISGGFLLYTGSLAAVFVIPFLAVSWIVFDAPKIKAIILSVVLFVSLFFLLDGIANQFVDLSFFEQSRVAVRAQNDLVEKIGRFSSGERMRGHEVFLFAPENVLWGVGRGANGRFGGEHEIHSTIAGVLYSYGLVGSLFFFAFFKNLIKWRVDHVMVIAPMWVWSVFHYTLNYPMFWLLHVFLFAMASVLSDKNSDSPRS